MINNLDLSIQYGCQNKGLPTESQLQQWVEAVLVDQAIDTASICIRFVDHQESAELNHRYRQQHESTNVLSFHYSDEPLTGDLAICPAVMATEVQQLRIEKESHWAHIIIHGVLHLLGYDHQQYQQAEQMEQLEIALMKKLGYDNPYQ